MHPTQTQLHTDHYNFLRLLACFQSEIACYECELESNNLRLPVILDILDYVKNYLEHYHHPIETKVFELLLVRNVPGAELVWGARSEHNALEKITAQADQLFSDVANDKVVPQEELMGVASEFIERQLAHINMENRVIYPLLDQFVSYQDWELVTQEMGSWTDPFFDESIRAEYHHLYRSILRAERGVAVGDRGGRSVDPVTLTA